jgi:hypothetical protein
MIELRYTLVTNGSSDTVLLPILTWALRMHGVSCAIQPQWADLRQVRWPQKLDLAGRVQLGLELYPCDLLFVHRDAEREPREKRIDEITTALAKAQFQSIPPTIGVVPVRMQEAWLLFDERAIRHAAGNRSGRHLLDLPPIRDLERLPDPKSVLHECLKQASGLKGRRLKSFPVHRHARRVAELVDDFSPLRALQSFAALEDDIVQIVERRRWSSCS